MASDTDVELCTEEAPLRPGNPYAASKAAADLLALSYFNTYGTPVTISRSSNNYGPRQFPEKLVPVSIVNACENKPIPLYGDGQNLRNWIYVEDHCRAIDAILHGGTIGEVYNVCTDEDRENRELVQELLTAMGYEDPDSMVEYVADRPGHDRCYAIDCGKLMDELGWEPRFSLEEGLARTIDWYARHENWWKSILDGSYRDDEHHLLGLSNRR